MRAGLLVGIAMVMIVAFAEGKLLNKAVVNSGLFSLLPGYAPDEYFAWAFAALPLAIGIIIRSRTILLDSKGRAASSASLSRWSRTLVKVWAFLVAIIFGPHFVTIDPLSADPFQDRPAWASGTSTVIAELQSVLQQLAALEIILLMFVSLVTASIVIGALLVNDREADARGRIEHVRKDEVTEHCEHRIEQLLSDRLATETQAVGRLQGILDEIKADRAAFVDLVAARVRHIQETGELHRRQAILTASQGKNLIDAGPLFARR